jgi:hypothetical protein
LNDAERLILEDHVVACPQCAEKLHDHRRLSATLFEAFSDARLDRSLRTPVLENLPEMQPLHSAMEAVNRRVKNPFSPLRLFAQYAPVFLVALVAFLAFNIYQTWPEPVARAAQVGAITYRQGPISVINEGIVEPDHAGLKDFVNRGSQYTTETGAALALMLDGPSTIKAGENTRFAIIDNRRIRLDQGKMWFDVATTGRQFIVSTAAGDVRVMGTIFGVEVAGANTIVTVLEGVVHVERGNRWAVLRDGYQLSVRKGVALGTPVKVDAQSALAWADAISPEADALAFFERAFKLRVPSAEVVAEILFHLDLRTADSDAEWSDAHIVVSWSDTNGADHCGYHVYITEYETRTTLFKHYIDGRYFDDTSNTQYEIPVPNDSIKGTEVLHVRLVPDVAVGKLKVDGLEVRAIQYAQ